jgi:hypothetical protein
LDGHHALPTIGFLQALRMMIEKENKEREFKMQQQMMSFMTAVMNRFPGEGGSGTMVAPSNVAFAPHDHSNAATGGDRSADWGGGSDDDSDKENW